MNNRIDAIYARQSVDKKDSISIESQIEFCKYELKGGNCKEYTDKGYSGKNTDRPKFQELVRDIKRGLIAKVVVYKLDRISRSILDFANMMELFQQYNVEFVSSTEKFDTSTPMGRAMLNICIVFAQLERETIQKRVTDAYYSRSQRGFKMGGKAPYGFHTEPIKMDGINTKKLVVNPEEAANIRLMFEMYAQPTTSYGDITRYFAEQGILFHGKELIRPTLAQMLRNPVYVQADLDVYEFFKSQGTVIVNDVADFTGMNGCYLYQGRDVKASKKNDLKDQMLVLAPHEGIVPSDTWLTCRKKLMNNMKIRSARKALAEVLALRGEKLLAVLFRAAKGAQARIPHDLVRLVPVLERQEHVRPHQKPQLIVGMLLMQNAQRVRGVALAAARDLHVGDCDLHARVERDLLAHQARHRKAVVRPCRVGGEHLVRRDTRRDEQELVEP